MQFIENKTFDEIAIGATVEATHVLTRQDIDLYTVLSGNGAPVTPSSTVAGQIPWAGALISGLIETQLPGPGTLHISQSLQFVGPARVGDVLTIRLKVRAKTETSRHVLLECACLDPAGHVVAGGEAVVVAPSEKLRRPRSLPPEVHLHERGLRFRQLIASACRAAPIATGVVHPCDETSLAGALDAAAEGLILPVLVGPQAKIRKAAAATKRSLDGIEIVDVPHSHAAAERAVLLAREGRVHALMKGSLHTDELMGAVVKPDTGLATDRRMSHVFALDVPHYPKMLFVTDAAVNIYPDLETKRDIVQNAIDLARALGIEVPKVAILSAVETVYPKITSTVDAAALCKMVDRGQITGGLVDGPLAFDNAVSKVAADAKGIVSTVAGAADILVAPDLEAGNMIAKQLVYLAGADAAGIVMGARVPIMLTSRADGSLARLTSSALAQLVVRNHQRKVA